MGMLPIVLVIAGLVVATYVALFVWSVQGGQLDDLETPAWRLLNEEGSPSGRPASKLPQDPRTADVGERPQSP